jgi:hypothetical protein
LRQINHPDSPWRRRKIDRTLALFAPMWLFL